MLDSDKLDCLAKAVQDAGTLASSMQCDVHRSFKKDGSVLTEADTAISRMIIDEIRTLFPEAAVISEEEETENNRNADWVFIIDPIDGTDVYSQGLPSFAVSVGVLDRKREPVGAYIAAPRFGIASHSLFVRLDPGKKVFVNGTEMTSAGNKDDVFEITTGSKGPLELDFSAFKGKIRVFGSTILHILAPVLLPAVQGVVVQKCYAWDIASSHAVMKALGMDLEDENGNAFLYTDDFIFGKQKLESILYGGTAAGRAKLRLALPPR